MPSKSELDMLLWAGKKLLERGKDWVESLDATPVTDAPVTTDAAHQCVCNHVEPVNKMDLLSALTKWFQTQRDTDEGPFSVEYVIWHKDHSTKQPGDTVTVTIDDTRFDIKVI